MFHYFSMLMYTNIQTCKLETLLVFMHFQKTSVHNDGHLEPRQSGKLKHQPTLRSRRGDVTTGGFHRSKKILPTSDSRNCGSS